MHLRALLITVLSSFFGAAMAQSGGIDSPYSGFALGDPQYLQGAVQAGSAGFGVAITEAFVVLPDNPAALSAMARPNLNVSTATRFARINTSARSIARQQTSFQGFTIGVPFDRGRWGMGFGLMPYSEVNYSFSDRAESSAGAVTRSYTGTGGLDRVFFGAGRAIAFNKVDSLGHLGNRLRVGVNLNFLFGALEQTRDLRYPGTLEFSSLRSFNSLVLRAPYAQIGLLWEGDITRKANRDARNWRYTIGAMAELPARMSATYNSRTITYHYPLVGAEVQRDSILYVDGAKGGIDMPIGLSAGASVSNGRWTFGVETRMRNWSAAGLDMPVGYSIGEMREARSVGLTGRLLPVPEGNLFQRSTYRAGLRYGQEYQVVKGRGLDALSLGGGISLPINAVQTNSHVNFSVEYSTRGTTDNGLVQEGVLGFWFGVTITPWKLERWFQPYRIQ